MSRPRSSNSYVGTITNDDVGARKLEVVRATVRKVNLSLKNQGVKERYRVCAKGRLGKDSPYAYLYRRGGKFYRSSALTISPKHSKHFDIYVYKR